jgi:hypothetical protein
MLRGEGDVVCLEGCRDGKGMGGVREFFCFRFEVGVY